MQSVKNRAPIYGKNSPTFGMKIILDEKITNNLRESVSSLTKASNNNFKFAYIQQMVDTFVQEVSKSLEKHNLNPKNHELYKDILNIKSIQVNYKEDLIANSFGAKTKKLKELIEIITNYDASKNSISWGSNLKYKIVLTDGLEIKANGIMYKQNSSVWNNIAEEIQMAEIKKIQSKKK